MNNTEAIFVPKSPVEQLENLIKIRRGALRNKRYLKDYLQEQVKTTLKAIDADMEMIRTLEDQLKVIVEGESQ